MNGVAVEWYATLSDITAGNTYVDLFSESIHSPQRNAICERRYVSRHPKSHTMPYTGNSFEALKSNGRQALEEAQSRSPSARGPLQGPQCGAFVINALCRSVPTVHGVIRYRTGTGGVTLGSWIWFSYPWIDLSFTPPCGSIGLPTATQECGRISF